MIKFCCPCFFQGEREPLLPQKKRQPSSELDDRTVKAATCLQAAVKEAAQSPTVSPVIMDDGVLDKELPPPASCDLRLGLQEYLILDHYKILEVLSQNKCGCVWKVQHKKTKEKFVLKKMGLESKNLLAKEYQFAVASSHPNVVKTYGYFEEEGYAYLLQELGECDLWVHINLKELTEAKVHTIFFQIASAVAYMHSQSIAHRDIKPENIIVFSKKVFFFKKTFKMADFGLAKEITESGRHTPCGSKHYLAPELLKEEDYDHTIDHWSLGVLLYGLAFGRLPFHEPTVDLTVQKIASKDPIVIPFHNRSKNLVDLIRKLLVKDPTKRLGRSCCQEILDHPWMKSRSC